jgi:hypothetical protein
MSTLEPEFLDFPYHLDGRGRSALTGADDHVRDLIMQVLFTNPGERVNRPDFGCGLRTLVFAPASEAIAAATKVLVKGALQQWLEQEIQVEDVDVRAEDSTLLVEVSYVRRLDGRRETLAVSAPTAGAPA